LKLPFSPPVKNEKIRFLIEKMKMLEIKEKDLKEKFIRASGHGGQKINKTSTCVYVKHIPTGIEVKCQQTRSQALNRFLARRLLIEKIEENLLGNKSSAERLKQKIRKQKLKRKKRARQKLKIKKF